MCLPQNNERNKLLTLTWEVLCGSRVHNSLYKPLSGLCNKAYRKGVEMGASSSERCDTTDPTRFVQKWLHKQSFSSKTMTKLWNGPWAEADIHNGGAVHRNESRLLNWVKGDSRNHDRNDP